MDPKKIVREGYDRLAGRGAQWTKGISRGERAQYEAVLMENLPPGAQVLEIGCGPGARRPNTWRRSSR